MTVTNAISAKTKTTAATATTATTAENIQSELKKLGNPEKAEHHLRFFKTGPGEYGENDKFIGVAVPKLRALSKKEYKNIPLDEIQKLLASEIHEYRQIALFFLVEKYNAAERKSKANESSEKEALLEKKEIVALYFDMMKSVNNWDLVDCSAPHILGRWYLETEPKTLGEKTIKKLSGSDDLWEQRISIMLTQAYIREGIFQPTLDLCEYFLPATHDLIHKSTGWMLREIGNQDKSVLIQFLEKHAGIMPRTMLRYSIEKLSAAEKERYMKMKSV